MAFLRLKTNFWGHLVLTVEIETDRQLGHISYQIGPRMKIHRKINFMAKETQFQVHSNIPGKFQVHSRFSRAISHSRYIPGFPGFPES